jgi:hypothetical protein
MEARNCAAGAAVKPVSNAVIGLHDCASGRREGSRVDDDEDEVVASSVVCVIVGVSGLGMKDVACLIRGAVPPVSSLSRPDGSSKALRGYRVVS